MFSTKMPLFGKSSKSPTEVDRNLKEDLLVLEKGGDAKKLEKARIVIKSKNEFLKFFHHQKFSTNVLH